MTVSHDELDDEPAQADAPLADWHAARGTWHPHPLVSPEPPMPRAHRVGIAAIVGGGHLLALWLLVVGSRLPPPEPPRSVTTLVFIAPERTSDPDTGLSFSRVRVEVPNEDLKSETAGTGARVGLPVEVFFQTGSRSLLAWAIRPVADQLNRAMRE